MNARSKKDQKKAVYPPAYTHVVPGQSLKPSDLLKRHLAGTLPPIDLSRRYEYHFNEKGEQVLEPLPNEVHELHKLSVVLRKRQYEEALENRKKAAEKHKADIIAEYERQMAEKAEEASIDLETGMPRASLKKGFKKQSPTPPKGDTTL